MHLLEVKNELTFLFYETSHNTNPTLSCRPPLSQIGRAYPPARLTNR